MSRFPWFRFAVSSSPQGSTRFFAFVPTEQLTDDADVSIRAITGLSREAPAGLLMEANGTSRRRWSCTHERSTGRRRSACSSTLTNVSMR